jgi:hypothetical protein
LGEPIALVVRLVVIRVRLASHTHRTPHRLRGILPWGVAVDCGLLLTQAELAASHLARGLEALMSAALAALSAEDLLGRAWDENADPLTKIVQVTIGRLRGKLGESQVIETIPSVGYRARDGTGGSELQDCA